MRTQQMRVTGAKRGKTRGGKSLSILAELRLIGWAGSSFYPITKCCNARSTQIRDINRMEFKFDLKHAINMTAIISYTYLIIDLMGGRFL